MECGDERLILCLPNAFAQFCLNNNIITHIFDLLGSKIKFREFYSLINSKTEIPNNRLYYLFHHINQDFFIDLHDEYNLLNDMLSQTEIQLDEWEINDLVNNCILKVLNRHFPNFIVFFHSHEVLEEFKRQYYQKCWFSDCVFFNSYDVSRDLKRRKNFNRYYIVK